MAVSSGLTLFTGLTQYTGLTPFTGLTGLRGVTEYTGTVGTAPTITSDGGGSTASVNVSPPATAVTTVAATGTAPVTFYIQGGADAGLFQIDAASGVLTFRDASVAGTYEVIVGAVNIAGADTQTITVNASASYHADAVHFDTSARLTSDAAVGSNSNHVSLNIWVYVDPTTNLTVFECTDNSNNYLDLVVDQNDGGYVELFVSDASNNSVDCYVNSGGCVSGQWNNFRGKIDTQAGTAELYNGLTKLSPQVDVTGSGFDVQFSAMTLYVSRENFLNAEDVCDFWLAPGVNQTFTTDGSDPFIDVSGRPKNPTGFPSAAVLLSGNASTFGQPNLGTGPTLTLTGSLADSPHGSPSD